MARIVVVDDEVAWRQLCENRLSELGHEVCASGDCLEALMEIHRVLPDLVVLDLRMPVSGRTMLHAIREDFPDLPVVVHTVYAGYRDDPSYSDVAGFAVKSPDMIELTEAVNYVLAGKRLSERARQTDAVGDACRQGQPAEREETA